MTSFDPADPVPPTPATTPDGSLAPRVYAILVVYNGGEWLEDVLDTIAAQRYPALELVVVDNGSTDGSGVVLDHRVSAERLVRFRRNVGFGRAVQAAMQRADMSVTDHVLLLHDDLVLAPDALERLVAALEADPALAVVGPKLREWTEEPVLQEVGMTIDRFGRAESPLEPGELDQGQHDRRRDVLYVSTAGMLVRAGALRQLGVLEHRYVAFRDDLDLCWRAWIAGWRVEVVPEAVGYHIGAAARGMRRLGLGRSPRELAERHALATLITHYQARRLLWILPVVAVLAVLKTVGFVVTRRVGDAFAVVRAYGWNLFSLFGTLKRRRAVQRARKVPDAELAWLFVPGIPRFESYIQFAAEWIAGGTTKAFLPDPDEPGTVIQPEGPALVRSMRDHPAAWTAGLLAVVYAIGVAPLLGPGQIVGGEILPWPASPLDFLRSYGASWSTGALGSAAPSSPAQALLGVAAVAGLWSGWLAQRLLVLGLLPLAWAAALRAGRLVTARTWPRVVGATLYVLSPVVLGAFAQGLIGPLAAAVLLPGLVVLAVRVVAPAELWSGAGAERSTITGAVAASAWRASALLALGMALLVAVAPRLWPLTAVVLGAALVAGIVRREGLPRIAFACVAALALLSPWVAGAVREGLPLTATGAVGDLPLWRALAVVPDVLGGEALAGGLVAAATTVAVVLLAVLLGTRESPALVAALTGLLLGSALATWGAVRLGAGGVWTPAFLLPAALAVAGLGVVAARRVGSGVTDASVVLRQAAVVGTTALLGVGVLAGFVQAGTGPWIGLTRGAELLPPFVTADTDRVGPYRILLLSEEGGRVTFDVVDGDGARMTTFGTVPDREFTVAMGQAVAGAAGGADAAAGARLGTLGVRYVVLDASAQRGRLVDALDAQPDLRPLPFGTGRAYRVLTWLPRVALLSPVEAEELVTVGATDAYATDRDQAGLARVRTDLYRGRLAAVDGGLLVVGEAPSPRWRALSGGADLQRAAPPAGTAGAALPLNLFAVPEGVLVDEVRATSSAHTLVLLAQAFAFLLVVSLALRPPGLGTRRRPLRTATAPPAVDVPRGRPLPDGTGPLPEELRRGGARQPEPTR